MTDINSSQTVTPATTTSRPILPWDKKSVTVRLPETLVNELDALMSLTKIKNRNVMYEQGMRNYLSYLYHRLQHSDPEQETENGHYESLL